MPLKVCKHDMCQMYTILRKLSIEERESLCGKKVKVDCGCGHKTYDAYDAREIAKKIIADKPVDFLDGLKIEDNDDSPNVENISVPSSNALLKLFTPDCQNYREDIDGVFWNSENTSQEITPDGKYMHRFKRFGPWYMVEGDNHIYHMDMTYPYFSDSPVLKIKYILFSLDMDILLQAHRNVHTHLWKANVALSELEKDEILDD